MTIEEKLGLIAETLDAEPQNILLTTELKSLDEWDSMGVISVIAMLDKNFGRVLDVEQIESLKTVQDIINFMA